MAEETQVRVHLLERFRIIRAGARLERGDWRRRKAAALMQRVALEGRLLRDEAIEFLWPDLDPEAGANNLYRTLHSLRKTLDERLGEGAAEATVAYADGVLALRDDVWVDVQAFEERLQLGDPAALEGAINLYQGDLLPDARYEDWTRPHRQALRQAFREACLRLAEGRAGSHEFMAAIDVLSPLLAYDPADEVVHRRLMRYYASAGRRHDALRQYQTCLRRLREDLGVDPSQETRAVYQQILEGGFPLRSQQEPQGRAGPVPEGLFASDRTPLVGRSRELGQLKRSLQAAHEGRGDTYFLEGFAGVGKTHLAHAVLRAAEDMGFRVMAGAAHEEEGQLPYQPFVEAFDRWIKHSSTTRSNPLSTAWLASADESRQDALALFRSVASFLVAPEHGKPFVVLVDDLHEADEGTLRLFHYLARQMPDQKGLLLATFRTGETSAGSPFAALLSSLYRERLGQRIKLATFDKDDVARILEHELGATPSGALVTTVYEISEGNPFFAQEITRSLRRQRAIVEGDSGWDLRSAASPPAIPGELVTLLKGRIREMGPQVEETLVAASILGREFRFELLHALTDLTNEELLDALDESLESDMVQETEAGYRFRHGLIRQALYDSLSRVRRQRLHRNGAEALEAMVGDQQDTVLAHVEDLAHHYSRSDRRQRAVDYLVQAGDKAARLYAFELAVDYLEQALALMDELGIVDPEQQFDLLVAIEGYHGLLADTPRAVEAAKRALQITGPDWRPSAEQRALVRRQVAIRLVTSGRLEEAETALEAALDELEGEPESGEYSRVLYTMAQLRWHQNRYREAFQIAEQSLAVAEKLADRDAIARSYEMLALAAHSLGEWQQGMEYEEEREALTGTAIDVDSAFDVHL